MPSRSNPNTPSSQRRKTAHQIKSKRKRTQRLVTSSRRVSSSGGVAKLPRTSQALRQTAPLSGKRKKKLEKKLGFDRARKEEEERKETAGEEVEMRDVDADKRKREYEEVKGEEVVMEVD